MKVYINIGPHPQFADMTLLKKLLNIEPISIEDGIERFIKYLKKD